MLADNVEDGACENPHPFTIEDFFVFLFFYFFILRCRTRYCIWRGGGGGRRKNYVKKFTVENFNIFYPSFHCGTQYCMGGGGGGGEERGGGGKRKKRKLR